MLFKLFTIGALLAAAAAVLWQTFLHDFLHDCMGVGREYLPVTDFPYTCKRIRAEGLSSCEDLWLDEDKRQIYAICAGLPNRLAFNTFEGSFNRSTFQRGLGRMAVIDIDEPGSDGLYGLRFLKKPGFVGSIGDDTLCTNGFDVEVVDADTRRFYMVDNCPVVNSKNEFLDIAEPPHVQASIMVFEHKIGSDSMQFKYKLEGDAVISPNRVIHVGGEGVLLTNDNSYKYGLKRKLAPLIGGGSLAYCDTKTKNCSIVADQGFAFPNGLSLGPDGFIYVPNSMSANIDVFELLPGKTLARRDYFYHPMPLDNFSLDKNGDFWVPGIASFMSTAAVAEDPWNREWASTIWRFRKDADDTWTRTKMLEDGPGTVAGGATTVVHDTETGRLFMGGAMSPHLTVCSPMTHCQTTIGGSSKYKINARTISSCDS